MSSSQGRPTSSKSSENPRNVTIVKTFDPPRFPQKIPTTFIPLAPERILIEESEIDILFGLFHIMWEDMPQRRTYSIRLSELLSREGVYIGCRLNCGSAKTAL